MLVLSAGTQMCVVVLSGSVNCWLKKRARGFCETLYMYAVSLLRLRLFLSALLVVPPAAKS